MTQIESLLSADDAPSNDRALVIREALKEAIIDRRLAPGTKLSEAEVGKLFDASRTVVRAALQILTFEGLVRSERNRGAFVSHPSPDEARQVFAARRLIEPAIVVEAAGRLDRERIERFRLHLKREAEYMAERGPLARRAGIKASGEFHLMLADVAGNIVLTRFMDELVARSSLVIALYGRTGASTCGNSDHVALLDALEAGDAERASTLMLDHIDHLEADLDLRPAEGLGLRDALRM